MDAHTPTSPFLPGTYVQYAWDSTSLGYFKRCPRLYYYTMIEGWESREESVHLRFGIELHKALQEYEVLKAQGLTHDEALHQVAYNLLERVVDFNPNRDLKPGDKKNQETLLRSVVWYLDQFEHDVAETLIWPDGSPAVEQSFRFELDWGPEIERNERGHLMPSQPYVLCGHLDVIKKYQGDLFGMDHKTTTRQLYTSYFEQYEPENQMTLYIFATQVVLGSAVRGMIIDAIQVGATSSRVVRGFTFRSSEQIQEWVEDLKRWLRLAEYYAKDGYWPQNDTACDKYGGCEFRSICSRSPQVRQRFLEAEFVKLPEGERWNPLRTR